MNFTIPVGILVITLGFKIFQNLKNRTKDNVILNVESTKLSEFFIRFFSFLSVYFLMLWLLKKGSPQLSVFWFFFSIFWFYLLNQKKVILEKGIGILDVFKSKVYLVNFNEIISFEKKPKNFILINYLRNNKEFQLKIVSTKNSLEELEKILYKKIKKSKK